MKHSITFFFALAAMALLASCKDNSTVTGPGQNAYVSSPITKDTLSGNIRGTMTTNHTYYIKDSVTVLAGDTLFVQSGVTVIALKTSSTLFVQGALDAEGTQAHPFYFRCRQIFARTLQAKGAGVVFALTLLNLLQSSGRVWNIQAVPMNQGVRERL